MATVGLAISLNSIIAEALALVKGLGLDAAQFAEVVTGGPLDSPYLQVKMKGIREGDFEPSFGLSNAEKDTRLVGEAARLSGIRVDLIDAAGERFRRAMAQGHGGKDMAATYFAGFPETEG
jgi:3-hydroxyisobutyrate dehydrogenase